jgi:serine phosphatase RsbU (regulator of sigma subunit)
MDWFRLQPISIPGLAQLILAAAILGYLLTIPQKSRPTRFLAAMFGAFVGAMLIQFLDDSVVANWRQYLPPLGRIFAISIFLPMMMFAYTFLGSPFEREYRLMRSLASAAVSLVVTCVILLAAGVLSGDYATVIQWGGLLCIVAMGCWTVGLFVRKAIVLSSSNDASERNAARAHRQLAMAFGFIPMVLAPSVLGQLGWISRALADGFSSVFLLLFFFAFVLVYINHAPEPTTVQVKLVGLSLVTMLVVLSLAGPISNPRIVLEREARWIVSTEDGLDYDTVYRDHAHGKMIGFFWVIIATSGLVMFTFPIFFRTMLLTRLEALLGGVRKINDGDFEVHIDAPVGDEIGFLTTSFNGMTASLRNQIEEIVDLSAQAASAEFERKLLEAENDRKTKELEGARQLQLSMLPKEMPDCAEVEVAATMETATEVGGDYYDFICGADGSLTVVVGDATGHGMNAGTVVAATKGLYHAMADEPDLTVILKKVSFALKKMNLPGLYMALGIARINGSRVELVGSGLPAALVYRAADASIAEYPLKGAPLGSFVNFPYKSVEFDLGKGDCVVILTDGFPELFSPDREMLGYERAAELLKTLGSGSAQDVIDGFEVEARDWSGGNRPDDDVTVVVLKAR